MTGSPRASRSGSRTWSRRSARTSRATCWRFSRARVRVVENVVYTDTFHPTAEPLPEREHGRARLLNVAAFAPKKAHVDLLEAVAELRRGGTHVTLGLVGEGETRPEVEQRAHALGLDSAVSFLGERPKAEVAEL